MRLRLGAAVLALLSGCASTAVGPAVPEAEALLETPPPEPTPLSQLSPPSRLQREIEAMSETELARWILPDRAADVARVELIPPRFGILMAGALWKPPRPAGPPGICEAEGWSVSFRVVNERELKPEQHVNPPLQPYQTFPLRYWKVVGSTLAGATVTAAECAAAAPYWNWPKSPSADALYRATNLMEQAQDEARGPRSPRYRLRCTQLKWEEGASDFTKPPCPDPRTFIQTLTRERIRSVKPAQCTTTRGGSRCWDVDYEVREAEGYFYYTAHLEGETRPAVVEITQWVPPPH